MKKIFRFGYKNRRRKQNNYCARKEKKTDVFLRDLLISQVERFALYNVVPQKSDARKKNDSHSKIMFMTEGVKQVMANCFLKPSTTNVKKFIMKIS